MHAMILINKIEIRITFQMIDEYPFMFFQISPNRVYLKSSSGIYFVTFEGSSSLKI